MLRKLLPSSSIRTAIIATGSVLSFVAVSLLLLPSFTAILPAGMFIDKQQEQKAFVQLNKVRKDPNSFSGRYGVSLKGISPRPDLIWNDSLAAVAERKAWSMAYRGYFGHIDPQGYGINYYINKAYPLTADQLKDKKQSNLEAIQGGAASGEVAIRDIIMNLDKQDPTGRQLILGEGDFNGSLTDVGIAFVHATTSTKYPSYTVIILASHQ